MAENKKKHLLHELLQDDQEPFHLNHYIADLRSQMGFSDMRLKKRKFQNGAVSFSCESSCFFATLGNNKSPHFELRSPANKQTRGGRVFHNIPASILLEAAARIKKQQSENVCNKTNNKGRGRRNGFRILGSVFKRLTNRKAKPCLDNAEGNAISLEPTSSCSRRERFVEEITDKCLCESPFQFAHQSYSSCSSSGHRTPHFTSTVTSPARRSTEEEDSDETESLEKVRRQEEDKEQCSPVSVLDPLEEEEEQDEDHHQGDLEHLSLLSCSFEAVQQAKRRLLKKLHRFENLAGLDPIEFKGKRSEDEEEEEEEYEESENAEEERRRRRKNEASWSVGLGVEENVDAVVQTDMREETREWTRHGGEVEDAASDLELSIFFFLIDEFYQELASSLPEQYSEI